MFIVQELLSMKIKQYRKIENTTICTRKKQKYFSFHLYDTLGCNLIPSFMIFLHNYEASEKNELFIT